MTIVAEVLVSKIVAEVESSSVVVPLVTPVVIGGGGSVSLSDDIPQPLGAASAGVGTEASRDDHVHAMPTAVQVGADPAGTAAGLVDDLSGVSDAPTARSNLGLGGSATLNVGTTAGTVAAGNHTHSGVDITSGTVAAARLPIDTDPTLATASDTLIASQAAVKAYVEGAGGYSQSFLLGGM